MSSAFPWLVVAAALGISLFGFRLRFPLAELATGTAAVVVAWWGLAGGSLWIAFVSPLVILPLFGIRIPYLLDGGGRRHGESEAAAGTVSEPARYVDGLLASRWPQGELELAGEQLRFRGKDGLELFNERLSQLRQISKDPSGRADLVIESLTATHRIALGRHRLGRDEQQRAQRDWLLQIETSGGRVS